MNDENKKGSKGNQIPLEALIGAPSVNSFSYFTPEG